jgi:LysM repeat protein
MNSHFNLGIALQNVGSKLQYISEKESLPQQGRIGFSSLVIPGAFQTSLMSDAVYSFDRKDVSPSVGIETIMGPLALRAGYKGGSDLENFSVGTGLHINRFSFDYSLGLVDKLSSRHRINVSMYFGNNLSLADQKIVSKPAQQESVTATPWKFVSSETTTPTFRRSMGGMTYEVKAGDTLQKIARQMYGDPNEWKTIYRANQHLMSSSNFRVGQKITLP